MSDLEQLKQRLGSGLIENEFLLDPRTVGDRLNEVAKYTQNVPFAGYTDAVWESFWMANGKPEALNKIYQHPELADKKLPVQQAFLLALLHLLETPKALLNTLPVRHRSLYYHDLLGFSPRLPQSDHVAVSFTLQRNVTSYWLAAGSLLDGGQDSVGNNISYQTDDNLLISGQQLERLSWTRLVEGNWKLCTAIDREKGITLPDEGIRLFTETENETDSIEKTQSFYLGFSGTSAQDTLSVYWSLRSSLSMELTWWYFNQNAQWVSLDAVVQDDTMGLSVSNLWQVRLPDDIQLGGDGLEAEYYWIKATLDEGNNLLTEDMPKLQSLFANAMTATLDQEQEIDDLHFVYALPANTISQLVFPVAAISEITQPLPSTGGQPRETDSDLLQRAASRIAHRHRAITWNDMRILLMDQYPQIYNILFPNVDKLSALPALEVQSLMVIPDSRYCDNDDILRPAFSAGRLEKMAQWLKQYTSLWAEPVLKNPKYIDVIARYQVIFEKGIHPDFGYRQLSMQLQQEYMPWGGDQSLAVTPGNKVDYYQLLSTLQQSPLVQSVKSLVLIHDIIKEGNTKSEETQSTITAEDDEVLILRPEGGY